MRPLNYGGLGKARSTEAASIQTPASRLCTVSLANARHQIAYRSDDQKSDSSFMKCYFFNNRPQHEDVLRSLSPCYGVLLSFTFMWL
jgi:hypothetical protein